MLAYLHFLSVFSSQIRPIVYNEVKIIWFKNSSSFYALLQSKAEPCKFIFSDSDYAPPFYGLKRKLSFTIDRLGESL